MTFPQGNYPKINILINMQNSKNAKIPGSMYKKCTK